MIKRGLHKRSSKSPKNNKHPLFKQKLTIGQKSADGIAKFGGSWTFIIIFFIFLISWMIVNSLLLIKRPFDPYPYILLNLALSCLAAIQAPVILMSQNRQTERDRIDAKYDYKVNRLAEREIKDMQSDLEQIKKMIKKLR
tara:strand:- start:13 stop:432 length:420 start_codon:yes stop_codon:yes gene_type:complete